MSTPSRYTARVDLRSVNDSHALAIGRVPSGSRVLDLGAADGSVAEVLSMMGCRVSAVELDPADAEAARRHCEIVVEEDLETLDLAAAFGESAFDVVLMLDILEHLSDPVSVLSSVRSVLAERGWAVISLPNVSHVSVRMSLLEGHFRYTDVGLLDRTHLRFFDPEGKDELLAAAGWAQIGIERITRRLGTTEIPAGEPDPALLGKVLEDPEALTYQFLVTAAPLGSPLLESPPVLPAAEAQAALLEAQERIGFLERQAVELERIIHASAAPDLADQLAAIRLGSLARREHLKALLASLEGNLDRLRSAGSG